MKDKQTIDATGVKMHKVELTDREVTFLKDAIHIVMETETGTFLCGLEECVNILKKLEDSIKQKSPSKPLRWFLYNQNNSGREFVKDDKVDEYVFIEAHGATEANALAEKLGIYFDGCQKKIDCFCCGDRWTECWVDEHGTETVELYGKPLDANRAGRSKIWNYETLRKL